MQNISCRSTSGTDFETQLMLTAPPATNDQLTTSAKVDLLSGDDLALVPVGEPQPTSPVASQQNNILALVDMFPQSNIQSSNSNGEQAFYSSQPHFQQQSNGQSPPPSLLPNGSASTLMVPQHEQLPHSQESAFAWNGQINQHQLPDSPTYGAYLHILHFDFLVLFFARSLFMNLTYHDLNLKVNIILAIHLWGKNHYTPKFLFSKRTLTIRNYNSTPQFNF